MRNWKTRTVATIDMVFRNALGIAVCLLLIMSKGYAQDRYFQINDESCPMDIRPMFREAANMWSFYGKFDVYEILNVTDLEGEKDDRDVIYCLNQEEMNQRFSLDDNDVAGNTSVWGNSEHNWIGEADVALSHDYLLKCVTTHEIGHSLGLALNWNGDDKNYHPKDPVAVMYAYISAPEADKGERGRMPCHQSFLTVTDLLMASEQSGGNPNCTPYIQKDFSIYFPNIKGIEAELVYNGQSWDVLWYAPSPKADWKCNVDVLKSQYNKGVWLITADLYDGQICVHANNCPTRRMSFSLEGGRLRKI